MSPILCALRILACLFAITAAIAPRAEAVPFSATYNGNGNTGGSVPVDSNSYNVNAMVTVLGAGSLTRTGYTFSHWATTADGSGAEYLASDSFQITQDTTLYAQWSLEGTVDYFEDFTNAGQPTHPSGTPWVMHNVINPAQATWNDFIPGDGKAYITVTSASHDDDRAYQRLDAGPAIPGQRLEIRAKNMACPGYTAFLFTYADEAWDEIDFDEIDIEIVASDDQGANPGHPIGTNGGWTDARFNAWANADAPSYTPWKGISKPVEDENGNAISHSDDEWHTYTIEWINDGGLENGASGRCVFYIDGVLQYTIDDMSPDSVSDVLIGYRDLSWAGPDNPIGWTGEHTMELDWYRVTPIDYQSPIAKFDTYDVENGVNVIAQSVLANDTGSNLTAVVLSQPQHGTLSLNLDGTFTYDADAGYSGRDHFVYYASDGTPKGKSNACVVELIINQPPTVDAPGNQTVYINAPQSWNPSVISAVAWFDAKDASTITKDGSNKVSQWNDKSGKNRHATQTNTSRQPTYTATDSMLGSMPSIGNISNSGQIGLTTPYMAAKNVYVVTYYKNGIDNSFDGNSTLFSGTGSFGRYRVMANPNTANFIGTSNFNDAGTYKNGSTTSSLTAVLPMPASIFKFKSSTSRGQTYGLGYNQAEVARDWQGSYCEWIFTDGTEDETTQQKIEGYLAHKWGLTTGLPSGHPYKNSAPTAAIATASLNGMASDPDGNALNYAWTDTGTGTGSGEVIFANPSAIDTTASFSQPGTYVLQLTANDGYTETSDQVTVTVFPAGSNTFSSWIDGYSVGGLTGIGDDPDGDGKSNGIENYFGTDPSAANPGIQIESVSREAATTFTFSHPINDTPASNITAAYIWTKDLTNIYADGATDGATTVSFEQGTPSGGMVTVTATITGPSNKVFVAVQVTQN